MTERMDALVADVQGRLNDWDDPLRLDDETLQLCQALMTSAENVNPRVHEAAALIEILLLVEKEAYATAVERVDALPQEWQERDAFKHAKAYALYRTDALDAALQCLGPHEKANDKQDGAVAHLTAQIYYKQGRFAQAAAIYLDAQDTSNEEMLSNMLAAVTNAVIQSHDRAEDLPLDLTAIIDRIQQFEESDMYETDFNKAALFYAMGEPRKAARCIARAIRIADGATEEEEDALKAQQALFAAATASKETTVEAHQALLRANVKDASARLVIMNNMYAISKKALSEPAKRLESAMAACRSKLIDHQADQVALNVALARKDPTNMTPLTTVEAAQPYQSVTALARICQETASTADQIDRLCDLVAQHDNVKDAALRDMLIVLLYSAGRLPAKQTKVIAVVERVGKDRLARLTRHYPILSTLLQNVLKTAEIPAENVSTWYDTRKVRSFGQQNDDDTSDIERLKAAHASGGHRNSDACTLANAYLAKGQFGEADRLLISQLAHAEATSEQDDEEDEEEEDMIDHDDEAAVAYVTQLEKVGVPASFKEHGSRPTSAISGDGKDESRTGGAVSGERKRKKRKNKPPKDYVEGRVPDPERWLPLRERSSFKRRKSSTTKHTTTTNNAKSHYLAGSSQGAGDSTGAITQHGGGSVGDLLKKLKVDDGDEDKQDEDMEDAEETAGTGTTKTGTTSGSSQKKKKKKKNKR